MRRNSPPYAVPSYHGRPPLVQPQAKSPAQRLENSYFQRPFLEEGPPISRGDFCLAQVPFTDASGSKVRPVLVLAEQEFDFVIVPLTARAPHAPFDVELTAWAESGLFGPGTARCSMIMPVSKNLLLKIIGQVVLEDWERISDAATRWFNLILA